MLEGEFKAALIKELKTQYPDSIILRLDPKHLQGIPDLLILIGSFWAALETKKAPKAGKRPNQPYYVSLMDRMSFARFINPENKEEVLLELQRASRSRK